MYFPIPGHPLGNENILLSCPPPVLHNTWGGHDTRKFLVSCPPPVLSNTGGGHDSKNTFSIMSPPCIGQYRGGTWNWFILIISGTLSFQALIKLITMWTLCVWLGHIGKYHLHSSKLGFNTDLEPAALGPYWTPISQNSDGISQYVLARRTVFYHCYQFNYEPIVIYLPRICPYITTIYKV